MTELFKQKLSGCSTVYYQKYSSESLRFYEQQPSRDAPLYWAGTYAAASLDLSIRINLKSFHVWASSPELKIGVANDESK